MACRIYNTFTESRPSYDPALLPQPFSVETPTPLSLDITTKTLGEVATLASTYCDAEQYNKLQDLRAELQEDKRFPLEEARAIADPFEGIGNSVFMNRNGVKMANMDAIYKFTGHYSSLLKQRLDQTYEKVGVTESSVYEKPVGLFEEDMRFTFCDVNDDQGAFAQYIQYRIKNSQGYAMNPIVPVSRNWNLNKLSTRYFTITYGEDGTGDLFANWDYFVRLVRKRLPSGVHLTMATGDTESEEGYLHSKG